MQPAYAARIIKNANRKEWERSRQQFLFGASCTADVLGLGRSSRNQLLQRYVWKAFKKLLRERREGGDQLWDTVAKKEDKIVNEFLQRKMANGCANEARMMKVVQTYGFDVEVDPTFSDKEVFKMTKGKHQPGDAVLDWTIVISPTNSLMACSPDGLLVERGLGYEFKTKDQVRVPSQPEEVLDCEYLQCQTCLSFCRDFVWAWILCYNRLDTGEFKAYLVVRDEELWDTLVDPAIEGFVSTTTQVAKELLDQCVASGARPAAVNYETFLNSYKYPPFERGVKADRHAATTASKRHHIFPIQFSD